jgi:hypothetical protein
VTSQKRGAVGIAIESRYLDAVPATGPGRRRGAITAHTCRPQPTLRWAGWEGERVTLSAPAVTVVKLFVDSILPAVAHVPSRPRHGPFRSSG